MKQEEEINEKTTAINNMGKGNRGGKMRGTGRGPEPAHTGRNREQGGKRGRGPADTLAAMRERLQGGRFRWINEMLYTETGAAALEQFAADRSLFDAYHTGYAMQVAKWPEDPLDRVIAIVRALVPSRRAQKRHQQKKQKQVQGKENQDGSESDEEDGKDEDEEEEKKKEKKKQVVEVADMGCGVARLAATLAGDARFVVHSYDLVAANARVEACNIAHVPLADGAVDAAVFCLSLMGTDYVQFLLEGRRVLRTGGLLVVAETKSRIPSVGRFVRGVEALGFARQDADESNTMFVLFRFTKTADARRTLSAHDVRYAERLIDLQPCIYKRR